MAAPGVARGVRLTIRTQAPDLMVRANAPSLVSAVLNLATNALQAAAAELDLELLARRSADGRAQIVVSDNGPGVPAQIRDRIFEPFFTTRARGNGIGLSIVKSVVEAHGGSVHLADSDCGATFVIELPAEEIHEQTERCGTGGRGRRGAARGVASIPCARPDLPRSAPPMLRRRCSCFRAKTSAWSFPTCTCPAPTAMNCCRRSSGCGRTCRWC